MDDSTVALNKIPDQTFKVHSFIRGVGTGVPAGLQNQ